MLITLSQDEVVEAVRAHVATTLPQLNFDNAEITVHGDCVEIDLDSVGAKSEKKPAKTTTRKKAGMVKELVEEPEPESEEEQATEEDEPTLVKPEDDNPPWVEDTAVPEKVSVPFGLEDIKKPSASLFGA